MTDNNEHKGTLVEMREYLDNRVKTSLTSCEIGKPKPLILLEKLDALISDIGATVGFGHNLTANEKALKVTQMIHSAITERDTGAKT